MKNNFKKLFLLPSLLLTQAYCLEQCVELNNNTNVDRYSEKIKIFSENSSVDATVTKEEDIASSIQEISQIELILFGFIAATFSILFFKNDGKFKFTLLIFLQVNKISLILILQKKIFDLIKSIKKSFHSKFRKIYFNSFVFIN
jgi:hypothetical protein